eukprot:m.229409 g.229409  ORF g.229409 m.229409 type:complete len:222 (+) comp17737_c0_seq1:1313-1978(+)
MVIFVIQPAPITETANIPPPKTLPSIFIQAVTRQAHSIHKMAASGAPRMNTCAALCLRIDDEAAATGINIVRREHDKAFDRWMPHINFIFPFIPEDRFADVAARLGPALAQIPAFTLVLDTIGRFEQRGACTVHIKPADESQLQAIFTAIRTALPEIPVRHGEEFHPHLTIGQWPKHAVPASADLLARMGAPFRVRVDHISIITRPRDGPFVTHTDLPLGQ